MLFFTKGEIPESVKQYLPQRAQEVYRQEFEFAWDNYSNITYKRGADNRQDVAHKTALNAVKKLYLKEIRMFRN